jgi:hypothetical protein
MWLVWSSLRLLIQLYFVEAKVDVHDWHCLLSPQIFPFRLGQHFHRFEPFPDSCHCKRASFKHKFKFKQ